MKYLSNLIIIGLTIIFVISCVPVTTPTSISEPTETEVVGTPAHYTLLGAADVVVNALKNRDMVQVAAFVHPEWGLRFTPYSYVSDADLIFSADVLTGLLSDNRQYTWGAFDGSGEPITMTFSAYFDRFIYSEDFASPEVIGVNKEIGHGNSINNIPEYYSGVDYVEYHFSGFDPQYEGMDWQSLRLVFKQEGEIYYLVGIVHAQWTI